MTWDEDEDHYVLSSGRRFYAYSGVLGVYASFNGELQLVYGHDGEVRLAAVYDSRSVRTGDAFVPEERREIADEMIARWMKWAVEGKP